MNQIRNWNIKTKKITKQKYIVQLFREQLKTYDYSKIISCSVIFISKWLVA